MSSTPFTREQEQAIVARGNNILVAAAAGAGKTATLVERVIRRLTDPVAPMDVDQLLVVTFTEAAASEMRDRIAAALQNALQNALEEGRAHAEKLQRQLALLGRASISTLHSFCLGLLRQYFYRLGLDPSLTVMNEHEAMLLRREVLDQIFAERFDAEGDLEGPFYALVDRYGGGRDDEGLKRLVLDLYDYAQSLPAPELWLEEACSRFSLPPNVTIDQLDWWATLSRQTRLDLARAVSALEQAVRLARLPGGPAAYEETLMLELERVKTAIGAEETWAGLSGAVQAIQFERLAPVKKGAADEQLQEQTKKLRDEARKLVRTLQENYFSRTAEEWLEDLRTVAPHLRTLVELVEAFGNAFRMAKADQGAVDFTDLERFALKLLIDPAAAPGELRPSDVALELQSRFTEILADEYQDINGVQDAILQLVAKEESPNRFMVGDVKQSIYRFRHADPSLFLQKYQSFQPWTGKPEESPHGAGNRIVLGANFRSRAGVVNAVNFLFRQILTETVGELAYDRDAELVFKANYPSGEEPPVEVHLLDRDKATPAVSATEAGDAEAEPDAETGAGASASGEAGQELAELSALEKEARLVARRIQELVNGTTDEPQLLVWDGKAQSHRPLRYRDIVILLRATTGRADLFLDALGRAGIPAYAQLATGYFAATEIQVVMSLLQVLDNPRQDIPLVAVLRSPIVGLSASDLARIRVALPGAPFYEAMTAASKAEDTSGFSAVLSRFAQSLEGWRTAARRSPLSQVIWRIYQETGYLRYVAGMPGGTQRHANLLALYDRARQFDQFARQGLFRFLRFIDRLKENEADLGAAPALGEGEDVVRVMSIHKSKGLEFPVVFVADLGKSFGKQDQQGDMLLQKQLGFGPQVVDPQQRVKYPTLAWYAVREKIRMEALAEEMRVLYVALTRARERLILVGSVAGLPDAVDRWSSLALHEGWALPDTLLAAAKSYVDWVVPALVRHDGMAALRTLSGGASAADRTVGTDPSLWRLSLWDAQMQQRLLQEEHQDDGPAVDWERIFALQPLENEPIQSETPLELQRRFRWQYPHAAVVPLFAKQTVTELKGHFNPETDQPSDRPADRPRTAGRLNQRPRFLQETRKTLTPTEFGTLMHLVLQHLDLTQTLDVANVEDQLQALMERQILSDSQVEAVNTRMVADFFATPLGLRMREHPDSVRREVSFTLGMPVSDIYPELDYQGQDREIVVVQGMIDVLIEQEDGFILVDYKTDKRDPVEAAKGYYGQVKIYRRAVESILGKPVREAYLHFLMENQSVLM